MLISKWAVHDEKIKPKLEKGENEMQIVRSIDGNLDYFERKQFARYIRRNKTRILDINEGIYKACDEIQVDFTAAKNIWIKTKNKDGSGISGFIVNPNYETPAEKQIKEIDFLNIFKDTKPFIIENKQLENKALFDRLVLTDIHIGMEVNQGGYAMYGGKWDELELFNKLSVVVQQVILHKKSKKLIIHELGDYLDGFDAMTTRGGHTLPQNMDNQKMFDVGLKFKIALIDSLIPHFEKIEVVNICNDNHAGSFGYIVSSAFKSYIELKYPNEINVINQRKFIDHYIAENRCFILTHGKDDKSLKFGFKPVLEPKQTEKIKNYIDEYKLYQYKCEFSKGDSHQLITDSTTSNSFEYQNFGAFSPPSDWVKTNFKNTLSCFTFFNYYETQKTINNYIFDK